MSAPARRIVRPAPARDLFAVPAVAIEAAATALLSPPAPTPAPAPAPAGPPRALRIRRDFAVARELVWGCDGRRFACRDIASFNGAAAYHVYTAWELADACFYDVFVERLTPAAPRPFGRIDTRRPLRTLVGDRAPIDWRLACEAEACALIAELCPETIVGPREGLCGVYPQPTGVLLTVDPAHRFAAALAAWRPTA